MINEFLFDEREKMFAALAEDCRSRLTKALADNGEATLMVSGGGTPAPLYQALSLSDLDWKRISVALIDERWVDRGHDASNEGLLHRTLLTNKAACAPFTGMKTPAPSANEGRAETEERYRKLPQPFTVAILGMGSDGHTASLFPNARGLEEALDPESGQLTAAIHARRSEVTGPNTERLTLTLPGLLKSARLTLLLTGEEKLEVFRKAMSDGDPDDMPVRAILRQDRVPVDLYWAP
ncbi:MAG: 6-phosphogluconolactonase [Gammaproteobacteria bacterium]